MKHILILDAEVIAERLMALIQSEFPDVKISCANSLEEGTHFLRQASVGGWSLTAALINETLKIRSDELVALSVAFGGSFLQDLHRQHPSAPVVLMSSFIGNSDSFLAEDMRSWVHYFEMETDFAYHLIEGLRPLLTTEPLIEFDRSNEIIQVRSRFEIVLAEHSISQQSLLELDPRDFEMLIAELWTRFGYEVELTMRTRDGGRDIIAARKQETEIRILVECKRYAPPNKVGVGLVRALYGVKVHERASKAILATSSSFTKNAQELLEAHRWELEGRDYHGILKWISQARSLR